MRLIGVLALAFACSGSPREAEHVVIHGITCPTPPPTRAPADAAQVADLVDAAMPDASAKLLTCISDDRVEILSMVVKGETFSFCIRQGRGEETGGDKGCFTMDLQTGTFAPAPVAWGDLDTIRAPEALPVGFTAKEDDGGRIVVCSPSGDCASTQIRSAEDHERFGVSDDGTLVYVIDGDGHGDYVTLHHVDLKQPAVLIADEYRLGAEFLGHVLAITKIPCAGPCLSTELRDSRGRKIAMVGGGKGADTSSGQLAHVEGDVWVFDDAGTRMVMQDVRTGSVVRTIDYEKVGIKHAAPGDAGLELAGREHGFVGIDRLISRGDVLVFDRRGALIKRIPGPHCTAQ